MVFGVVALALLMSSLDQTIVATALGTLQRDLDASITWAGWTMTAYSLGLVLMLPVAGTLSQRYGRRRIFMLSVVLFSGASLCCGLAENIYVLVALRFLQAVGGAGFTPSATGLIVEHFGAARDKAVGLFGSIFSIGAMIGPIFGGLFVSYWSWRGIFFVNVPIGALLIVLCLRFIPRDAPRAQAPQARFDFLGMAQLGIGLLGAMLALNAMSAGAGALRTPEFLVPTAAAIVSLILFARHTRDAAHPLIPARFIAGRGFAAANMVSMVYGGMVAGVVALVPLYATTRYGISALGSGTLLIAEGAAVIIMSTLGALTLRRTGYRLPIYGGAIFMAIGTCMLALDPRGMSPYAWLATAACLIGLGAGWSSPASRNAADARRDAQHDPPTRLHCRDFDHDRDGRRRLQRGAGPRVCLPDVGCDPCAGDTSHRAYPGTPRRVVSAVQTERPRESDRSRSVHKEPARRAVAAWALPTRVDGEASWHRGGRRFGDFRTDRNLISLSCRLPERRELAIRRPNESGRH